MYRFLRWIAFLPLAFGASVLIGAIATWVSTQFGASSWYIWLLSGAASGTAFFLVALHVAPSTSPIVKWTSVTVVGVLGLLATLGPLMTGHEPMRALAGAAMVLLAVYYARRPMTAIRADVDAALRD